MADLDGNARLAVELAAEVVRPHILRHVEALGDVQERHDCAVAEGEIRAGEAGVVRADPAAQGNLQDDDRQRGGGEAAQVWQLRQFRPQASSCFAAADAPVRAR